MHSTGITFPDNTTQTTAASGGGPIVDQYAIGSYVMGRPGNVTSYNNSTIAGSSLYAVSNNGIYKYGAQSGENQGAWNAFFSLASTMGGGQAQLTSNALGTALVNVGSWRCVSISGGSGGGGGPDFDTNGSCGLWVRYA